MSTRWSTCWVLGLLMVALLVAAPRGSAPSLPQRSNGSLAIGGPLDLSYVLWNKTYGTGKDDSCHSLIHCRNGGFALIGSTSPAADRSQVLMVRVDENGTQLWSRTIGGGYTFGRGGAQTEDDGFAVFAAYQLPMILPVFGGMWLVRLDSEGNHLWNRSYSNPPTDGQQHLGGDFASCRDGGFALLGAAEDSLTDRNWVPWIVRTDANGTILWNRVYRSQQPGWLDYGAAISECSDGGLALTGRTESYYECMNAWLLRVDSEGNHLWNRTYEPAWLHGLAVCNDGGFALAGYTFNGSLEPPFIPIVIRTDSQGNTLWEYTYGCSGDEGFTSILELEEGGFALTGFTNSSGKGDRDMMLMRISPDGDLLWRITIGGSADDFGGHLVRIRGDGFAVAGSTASFGAGGLDMWLVRLAEPENTPPTWIEPPVDQTILFGVPFRYDLNATDSSGVSHWRLDDTAYFVIDNAGIIANATVLPVGSYSVRVVVYDIYNNALGGAFALMVLPTRLRVFIAILPFVLIVMLAASVVAIFGLRRHAYRK